MLVPPARRFLLAATAGVALLAGCAGAPDSTSAGGAAPPNSTSAQQQVDEDEVPADARAAYLAGLTAIDNGLTTNEDRAIRRAENICADIAADKDEQTVIDNTVQRLSSGDATINEDQAAAVVALARTHLCTT